MALTELNKYISGCFIQNNKNKKILTMFKTAQYQIRSRDKIQPITLHEICLISNIFPPYTNSKWNKLHLVGDLFTRF